MDKLSFSTIGVNIHDNGKPDEIATPIHICNDMTELFPSESFTDTSKIWADIYCKTGNTLKALKQHGVSKENIVAICPTLQSQLFACRQLYGKLLPEVKIDKQNKYPDVTGVFNITRRGQVYYITNWKEIVTGKVSNTNALTIINKIILNEMRSDMSLEFTSENGFKFNNIIMNPPYNNDMYLDFVTLAHKLATDNVVAITPAKWQAKGGAKNEAFRRDIVPYMSKIVYYPNESDVFDISMFGGISFFLVDKMIHTEKTIINISNEIDIFNNTEVRKFNNILNNHGFNFICNLHIEKSLKISDMPKEYKYKYIVNKLMSGKGVKRYNNGVLCPAIIDTDTARYGENYLIRFSSDNKNDVESFVSYLNTKFVRYIILLSVNAMFIVSNENFRFVPAPQAFDHIFTDQELYKEYDLTDEEIAIIESVIKERK